LDVIFSSEKFDLYLDLIKFTAEKVDSYAVISKFHNNWIEYQFSKFIKLTSNIKNSAPWMQESYFKCSTAHVVSD
jgi:hypothetical protein